MHIHIAHVNADIQFEFFLEARLVMCMLRMSIEIIIEGHVVHNNNKCQTILLHFSEILKQVEGLKENEMVDT